MLKLINWILGKFGYMAINHRNAAYDTCEHCHKKVDEYFKWTLYDYEYSLCKRCDDLLAKQNYAFLSPNKANENTILYLEKKGNQ